jgi:hypothetical protein
MERICAVTVPHAGNKGEEWCPMDDRKEQEWIANDHTLCPSLWRLSRYFISFPDFSTYPIELCIL